MFFRWRFADEADRSSIEWWNPVTGCTKISPGCKHCYAETFAERFRGVPGHAYEQGFDLKLWPDRLGITARWKSPRMIFVNSMSDLFHEKVSDDFIKQVFLAMAVASWHTFQVLTKRSDRMAEWHAEHRAFWHLPNVWLGASVEDPRYRLPRTPHQLNVEIPRGLWRHAKIRAAKTEKSLREIVIEALENYLGAKAKKGGGNG